MCKRCDPQVLGRDDLWAEALNLVNQLQETWHCSDMSGDVKMVVCSGISGSSLVAFPA